MSAQLIGCFNAPPTSEMAPHQTMPARWLANHGYPFRLMYPGQKAAGSIPDCPRLEMDPVGGNLDLLGHLTLAFRILKARVHSRETSVFYVHGSPVCPAAYFGLFGLSGNRIIYHTQDFLEPGRHPHWEFFEKRLARRAGWVICNEPNRARFLQSHYRLRKTPTVVRTALPRSWSVPDRDDGQRLSLIEQTGGGPSHGTILIMAGGTFSPVRCSIEVIQALALLPEKYRLVFTGSEPGGVSANSIERSTNEWGVRHRVALLPRLDFQDLLAAMAACDLGLLLYPNDGIGNFYQAPGRLTEYLRCGLPLVTSDAPSLELLRLQYQLGESCDGSSPRSIAEAILAIGDLPIENRIQVSLRLKDLALTELSYDRQAHRIEEIVRMAGVTPEPTTSQVP